MRQHNRHTKSELLLSNLLEQVQLWSLPQVQPVRWQLAQGDPFYLQLLKCFDEDISDDLMRQLVGGQLVLESSSFYTAS